MKFQNPTNGYIEEISMPFLWIFIFGVFYFAYKGIWSHFVISFALAIMTVGFSWLVYPFFGRQILRKHYLSKGWNEI